MCVFFCKSVSYSPYRILALNTLTWKALNFYIFIWVHRKAIVFDLKEDKDQELGLWNVYRERTEMRMFQDASANTKKKPCYWRTNHIWCLIWGQSLPFPFPSWAVTTDPNTQCRQEKNRLPHYPPRRADKRRDESRSVIPFPIERATLVISCLFVSALGLPLWLPWLHRR